MATNKTSSPSKRSKRVTTPKLTPHASSWEILPNPLDVNGPEVLVLFVNNKPVVQLELKQENLTDLMDALNDRLFTIGATEIDAWYLRDSQLENLNGVLSFSANHAVVGSLALDDETLKQLVPALLRYYDPRKSWSKSFWNWAMNHKISASLLGLVFISLITLAVVFQ